MQPCDQSGQGAGEYPKQLLILEIAKLPRVFSIDAAISRVLPDIEDAQEADKGLPTVTHSAVTTEKPHLELPEPLASRLLYRLDPPEQRFSQ
jgi:hypothetical protein